MKKLTDYANEMSAAQQSYIELDSWQKNMSIVGFSGVDSQNNSSSWVSVKTSKVTNSDINKSISLVSYIGGVGFVGLRADFLKNFCYVTVS